MKGYIISCKVSMEEKRDEKREEARGMSIKL
jgi:hypothetical protein